MKECVYVLRESGDYWSEAYNIAVYKIGRTRDIRRRIYQLCYEYKVEGLTSEFVPSNWDLKCFWECENLEQAKQVEKHLLNQCNTMATSVHKNEEMRGFYFDPDWYIQSTRIIERDRGKEFWWVDNEEFNRCLSALACEVMEIEKESGNKFLQVLLWSVKARYNLQSYSPEKCQEITFSVSQPEQS